MYIPSEQELWLKGMTSEQWLEEHDAEVKVYERTKTIDECIAEIRRSQKSITDAWVNCLLADIIKRLEWMKEQKNETI